jgi:hypothetical protein
VGLSFLRSEKKLTSFIFKKIDKDALVQAKDCSREVYQGSSVYLVVWQDNKFLFLQKRQKRVNYYIFIPLPKDFFEKHEKTWQVKEIIDLPSELRIELMKLDLEKIQSSITSEDVKKYLAWI